MSGHRSAGKIGGPCQQTGSPNDPTFDQATHSSSTEKTIIRLLSDDVIGKLTQWERSFLVGIYGERLSRSKGIKVSQIARRVLDGDK